MRRVRVTIKHNPDDPADDLRCAARVRRSLWAHSAVEIDPDSPNHATRRDDEKNAYFEFATDRFPEVVRVLQEQGFMKRAEATIVKEEYGTECVRCGQITPKLTTVCPNCGFRDVEPCPHCNHEVPRTEYTPILGNLFTCPVCGKKVRLNFQDPLFDVEGTYQQPLVLVTSAEVATK